MHRILLFEGHWYALYSYGFMLVVAMICGISVCRWRARRFGVDDDTVLDACLSMLVGALILARLLEVVEDWPAYSGNPIQILNIRAGGLSWHGGVAGGFLGLLWYCRRRNLSLLAMCDLCAPGMIVGHILGRVGCFLNGCCYGRPCSLPWAVTFPDAPELGGLPRHPTQMYEVLAEIGVLALVLLWERRVRARGSLFYLYLCLYSVERFIMEMFRMEPVVFAGLTIAQWFSIILLCLGGIALVGTLRSAATTPDAASLPESAALADPESEATAPSSQAPPADPATLPETSADSAPPPDGVEAAEARD